MTSFFVRAGLSYSFVTLLSGIINWVFWLIAVRLTNASNIGLASALYSVPMLLSSISLLSMEYPLLKNSSKEKSYFGTIIIFESIIHIALIPILIISIEKISNDYWLMFLSVSILFGSLFSTVSNYSLLGSFSVRPVFVLQMTGILMKIILLTILLIIQFGTAGILLAILSQLILISIGLCVLSSKKFGFYFKKESLKNIIVEGLSNFPSKLFIILQSFGTISIMAILNITRENIAAFTIAYGIIVFLSAIPSSLSQIAISASIKEEKDLSSNSFRIGMTFTLPFITILLSAPAFVLGIYGSNYSKYHDMLMILSISLVPFLIKTNVITMLNNQGNLKKLIILGLAESLTFLGSVFILILQMGENGGVVAITIASIVSGIISLFWVDSNTRRIFLISLIPLSTAYFAGFLVNNITHNEFATATTSFGISVIMLFVLKLIKFSDITSLMKQLREC